MLHFRGNQIWRGTEKVGWVDGHRLYDEHGKKIAAWDGDEIFNGQGERMLKVRGNDLVDKNGRSHGKLDDMLEAVPATEFSEMARVAIKLFLGAS
jgi:hypothetical protein